jgi:hypothetical protein
MVFYVRGITNEENVYLCDFETTRDEVEVTDTRIKNKYKTKLQLKLDLTYLLDISHKKKIKMAALTPEELAKLALEQTKLATIQLKEQAKLELS